MQVLTAILFLYIVSRPSVILFLAKLSGKALNPKGIRSMQKGQCMLVGTLLAFYLADHYAKSGAKAFIYAGIIVIDILILVKSPELLEIPIGGYTSLYGPVEKPDAPNPESKQSTLKQVDSQNPED